MASTEDVMEFVVTQTREIAGQWREKNARVFMTEQAAKYYLPPCGSGLARPKAKRAKATPIAPVTEEADEEADA
jgi:hypothetical protein